MIESLLIMLVLSLVLWRKWDWFTEEFSDRKIEKFFDDNT